MAIEFIKKQTTKKMLQTSSSSSSTSSSSPNSSNSTEQECPLCMETLDLDDKSFFPCTCGYQICRFCWHRILTSSSSSTDSSNSCPACRKTYSENPANFKPISVEDIQLKLKQQRKLKDLQKKAKTVEGRKHLGELRVVQKNLVFVVGITPRIADAELLKKGEYFGRFGKIHKVVVNCVSASSAGATAAGTTPCSSSTTNTTTSGLSYGAYITYTRSEDALRAIQSVNNIPFDGKTIKASLGTTKYCSHFMRNQICPKGDCMYLHSQGDSEASFTKEDMQQGKHQEYERKLIEEFRREQQREKEQVEGGEVISEQQKVEQQQQPKPLMIPLLYKSDFNVNGFEEEEVEEEEVEERNGRQDLVGDFSTRDEEEQQQRDYSPPPPPPPQHILPPPVQTHTAHAPPPLQPPQLTPPQLTAPPLDFNPFSETQSQFESIIQAEMANWQLSQQHTHHSARQNHPPPPGFDNNLDEWIDPAIIYSKSMNSRSHQQGQQQVGQGGRGGNGGGNIGHLLGNSLLNDIFCAGGSNNAAVVEQQQQRHFLPPQQQQYYPPQQQPHTYYKPPPGFQPPSPAAGQLPALPPQQQFINNNFFNNFPF